ncbi:LCP family protein [Microbacterium sp. GXF6406]
MSEKIRRRKTVARHGQLRTPGPISQLLKIIGISLSVVLVSGLGVGAFVVSDLYGTATAGAVELDGEETIPPDISAFEGGFDLMLVGLDTCEEKYAHLFGERCEGKGEEGNLNDVNILVHVSDEPRRITAVSFPRDLMVPIPECTDANGNTTSAMSKQPLNSAYSYGGLNCVARTITELTGQDVEFAASVTFGGVIEITDAIGGVDVCLATPIRDRNTGIDWPAGTRNVQGLEALQFLRTRYGVGDGSDLGRIGNQQQYMSSLARKLISDDVLGSVPTMLKLANTALSNLEASNSLTNPMMIAQVGLAVKDVPFEDIVFLQYPNLTDSQDNAKVVPDYSSAEAMWDAINANEQLEITHENSSNEGVIVQEPETTEEAAPAPEETVSEAPAPTASAVPLPNTVKGNSAAQQTCSNGNIR